MTILHDAMVPACDGVGLATDIYLPPGSGPFPVILGPWTHGDRSLSHAGGVDFGRMAAIDGDLADDFFEVRRRWFDHWLRGVANGVDAEPAVRVFVMGAGPAGAIGSRRQAAVRRSAPPRTDPRRGGVVGRSR
ncbi:MAG TPA: hypothetical protein VGG57_16635 [Stellaceae bacterium]